MESAHEVSRVLTTVDINDPARLARRFAPRPPAAAAPASAAAPAPRSNEALDRLVALVHECDYRGGPVAGSPACQCHEARVCGLGRGADPEHPQEVTLNRCLQCVSGHLPDVQPDRATADTPGFWQKASNLAGAVIRHVAGGLVAVSSEEKARRLALCRSCERYQAATTTCGVCGCFVNVKTGWARERCPLDPPVWGTVEVDSR